MTVLSWSQCWTGSASRDQASGGGLGRVRIDSSPTKATATRVPALLSAAAWAADSAHHPRATRSTGATGGSAGAPLAFDKTVYARRNVVERCINRLKQWRGLATRYEKRAVNYRAMVVIASIVIWLDS